MATTTKPMSDLKKHIVEGSYPQLHISAPHRMPDPKHLGIHILTKVIPKMEEEGDVAFVWFWAKNDLAVYNKAEYDEETGNYKRKHKLKCDAGDTTWFYDYTYKEKKRRCIITTEIWYDPKKHHNISPVAIVFGQYMGNGLHIAKCRWEDVE